MLCLQRHELVAVKFRRTGGMKYKHELDVWMEVEDWNGVNHLSEVWTTKTPRFGWKMISEMRDGEVKKWRKWMCCERKVMK